MTCKQLSLLPELEQEIIHGDCLEVMKTMDDNSIDFICCDPPYGLNFMGKKWDDKVPNIDIWTESLRICKPGSMLAAFGGSRTHHHLMLALEKSGWEIRDVIMWLYGSGFPKSHNKFGLEGYGTALKPAYEPIILAMKPLEGTYKQNAEKWGVAGININESRIEGVKRSPEFKNPKSESGWPCLGENKNLIDWDNTKGRWPSNLILSEEAAEQLDHMTGVLSKGHIPKKSNINPFHGSNHKNIEREERYLDSGGASRFFYVAKASSSERNKGLEGKSNTHCTVKPLSLMKYILKLLAPPGNPICLDPFAGSGSTLLAAKELGINCIGIEKELEYYDIAKARLA
jgi:site-specific DNA-methyltransferase (adenine-specific)